MMFFPGTSSTHLWADSEIATLLGFTIDSPDNIDQLLPVLLDPVELVILIRTETAHLVVLLIEEREGEGS
jgi:hypothetical protein